MKKKLGFLALISALVLPLSINAQEITKDTTLTKEVTDGILVKNGTTATLNLGGQKVSNTSGDTIKVEKGATLTIIGDGDVTNKIDNKAVVLNEGTLVIKGGKYTRNEQVEGKNNTYYVFLNQGTATIDGGTFEIDSTGITGNAPSSLISNGWYTPSQNTSKEMSELTINDGTFRITNNNKYIKNDDFGIMTVNGGSFTMNVPSTAVISNQGFYSGKETVTVNGGTFTHYSDDAKTRYVIWDKDWHAENSKNTDNSKTVVNGGEFNINNINTEITNGTIKSANIHRMYKDDSMIQFVVVKEDELEFVPNVEETDVGDETRTLINDAIKNKYIIGAYYDIVAYKSYNGEVFDYKNVVAETDEPILVTLNIPSSIKAVEKGYKRTYKVIRIHYKDNDRVVDILDATLSEDGKTVSFKSDKFSTYALVYADTKEEAKAEVKNPNTADNISLFAVIAGASLAGALVSLKSLKKRKNNA